MRRRRAIRRDMLHRADVHPARRAHDRPRCSFRRSTPWWIQWPVSCATATPAIRTPSRSPRGHDFERLAASDPPIGMNEQAPATGRRPWNSGRDLLVLFTDGVSDARSPDDARLGEDRVLDTIRAHRDASPSEILERVIEVLDAHASDEPRRDDLTLFFSVRSRGDQTPARRSRATRPSANQEESRSAFSE